MRGRFGSSEPIEMGVAPNRQLARRRANVWRGGFAPVDMAAVGLLVYPIEGNVDGISGDAVILAPPFNASAAEFAEICGPFTRAVRTAVASLPAGAGADSGAARERPSLSSWSADRNYIGSLPGLGSASGKLFQVAVSQSSFLHKSSCCFRAE